MTIAGLVLAAVAGLVHVFIFWLESMAWTTARARRIFGTTSGQAEDSRVLAFNQGFYNLILAVMVFGGIVVTIWSPVVGSTLVLTGTGAMLAAALVLFVSSPNKRGAAATQGLMPLLAIIALVIGVLV